MSIGAERFYPASREETMTAVVAAAERLRFKVKGRDDFAGALTFTTPARGFSWGATMTATVMPERDGAVVSIRGAAKARLNLTAKSPEFKNAQRLLDATSEEIQAAR